MLGDSREKVLEAIGSKRGSVSTSSSNFSLVARMEMSGGRILRPVAGSTVSMCPLKTTVLTIQNLFTNMGYETDQFRASGDGGIDCMAYKRDPVAPMKIAVQGRRPIPVRRLAT
jgi:Restriction endonuclease